MRISGRAKLIIFISLLCFIAGSTGCAAPAEEITRSEAEHDRVPRSVLPIHGEPKSIITVHVNRWDPLISTSSRLAVFYYDETSNSNTLRMFAGPLDDLSLVYSVTDSESKISWTEMDQFPSIRLPGVVLWGSETMERDSATVICHTTKGFRVVFEGFGVSFLELDNDGIPEVFSSSYPEFDAGYTDDRHEFMVHTWNGTEFVLVKKFQVWEKRFSNDIIRAVREVKKLGMGS